MTWNDLAAVTERLAIEVAADGGPDVMVGVLRGGMVPTVLIAHQLGVRAVRALEVTRTLADGVDAAKSAEPVVANVGSLGALDGADVVLVDDVAGSGDTLYAAAAQVRLAGPSRLRTLVYAVNEVNWTRRGRTDPSRLIDHLGVRCQGWVRFPWETR